MKRIFLTLFIAALAAVSLFAQPESMIGDTINGPQVAVLDSVVQNDMKLLIISDRLYSKNGLIETLVQQASKEKAETGTIVQADDVQAFIDGVGKEYEKLLKVFVRVDTVWVVSLDVDSQVIELQAWQQSVLNDPEIKNVTTLSIWESKNKELAKLLEYQEQLKKTK